MRTATKSNMRVVSIALAGLMAAVWSFAQTENIKETERFVKAGGATSQAIAETRLKTKNALDAYNGLVQGDSKNMKSDYKKLLNTQKDMNASVDAARNAVADMDKQAAVYFTSRSGALSQIQDATLRSQAKTRLDASQKEFESVKVALKEAGDVLTPFTKDLSDQIKYMGAELTPSATSSLKPQADKLNERAAKVFEQADSAVTTANKYFGTLRPQS